MTKTSGDTQFSLTVRQRQVVELIALGFSNEEVGERLGISARTAKAHCDVLRQKLGVPRRRQIPAAFRTLTGEDPLACELAPAAAGVGADGNRARRACPGRGPPFPNLAAPSKMARKEANQESRQAPARQADG